ncbi:hypothetical protein ASF66_13740 [Pseudomonas sp. Leaf129]|uniref:fimbrial protein n=1 Tax=Pseudomonas sp. Leaf129 TaxID=1736268 RepID=UPI0007035AB8|nr:fimbrial protein [Pseudomonas sp. Leaf129]KQQ60795.1 hypothetical protein ASF66_13740 [Pseudomonas sp. Leaf129]
MRTTLLASSFLAAAALAPLAHAVDGTINFTGTILDAACTVDPGSANQTVPLGNVNKSAFVTAGDRASSAPFVITVNACNPAITRVAVRFDGPTAPGNPQLLALSAGGTPATGVGIGIYEAVTDTLVPPGTKSVGIAAPAAGSAANLEFTARYVSTVETAAITAGPANGTATFTLDYN